MALFERREREKEREKERERETGHRLTGFIVEPNDHACVRFFFFFLFEALTKRTRMQNMQRSATIGRQNFSRWTRRSSSWSSPSTILNYVNRTFYERSLLVVY